jgi:stage V sporulation protein B
LSTTTREPRSATAASEVAGKATTARAAGRGGLAIAVAKISFVLFGFAQQLALPAILGTDGYGVISRILAIVGIVNNVVVALSIQGVSRTVSSAQDDEVATAFRRVLWIHAVLAVTVATGFALLAGTIADGVKAPYIAGPLRIIAVVVFLYGVYAPLVGSLNGRQRFVDQAGLDILYGGLRLVTTLGLAFAFARVLHRDGVTGGVLGFSLGALLIVPVALTRAGTGKAGGDHPSVASYTAFLGPLALGLVALNVLLQTDFLLFSRFVGDDAARSAELFAGPSFAPIAHVSTWTGTASVAVSGLVAPVSDAVTSAVWSKRTDELAGVYRAFQLFSFLPYQLLMSVTFVLFPMLARAHADADRDAIRSYTRTGMRLAFILVGLFAGVVAAIPFPLLRFAFADPFIGEMGHAAQRLHALGMGAFAILGVVSTALTSLRRERAAAWLTLGAVGLVAGACAWLVPRASFGEPMMLASASATLAAMGAVAVLGCVVLYRTAGGLVPWTTPVRVVVAMGAAVLVGTKLPFFGRLTGPIEAVPMALTYFVVLAATRELGADDLAMVKRVLGRKKASPT